MPGETPSATPSATYNNSENTESATQGSADYDDRTEAADVGDSGVQRVGTLVHVDKLLGDVTTGSRTEKFSYPGASYVKLHFDRMAMRPGDYVTVSNPSGTESYRYDAPTEADSDDAGQWAMSITGDTAVLEMHQAESGTTT